MTMQEYTDRLKRLAEATKLKAVESVIVPAANEYLATKKNTIVKKGEKSDGSRIGNYSTKPMYATKDQFVKKSAFKPITKKYVSTDAKSPATIKGRKVLASVFTEKGKSMYLREGYKELRDIQGRPTDKVNLNYSGDLIASLQMRKGEKAIEIGLTNEFASKKKAGNEKRFGGKIFQPQEAELATYQKNVNAGAKTFVLKFMNGNV